MPAILGKKLGMTQIFTEEGDRVPVTVVEAGPCTVTQVKTESRDGYSALQFGFGEVKERRVNKPLAGHFKKAGVKPLRYLAEIRVAEEEAIGWILPPAEAGQKKTKEKKKSKAEVEKTTAAEAEEAAGEVAEAEAAAAEPEAGEAGAEAEMAEAAAAEETVEPAAEEEPPAPSGPAALQAGCRITVDAFQEGQKIKVSGVSKGKGFAGVIKRHGFSGGPGSHGAHFHRAPGSVGASAYPSRVFKGLKLPGQMGNKKSTQRGLTVFKADADKNLLFIKGSIPGSNNDIVFIQSDS